VKIRVQPDISKDEEETVFQFQKWFSKRKGWKQTISQGNFNCYSLLLFCVRPITNYFVQYPNTSKEFTHKCNLKELNEIASYLLRILSFLLSFLIKYTKLFKQNEVFL